MKFSNFMMLALATTAVVGCSDNDFNEREETKVPAGVPTYASFSFSAVADQGPLTRAGASASIEGQDNNNNKDTYTSSKEKYRKATVYVLGTGVKASDPVLKKEFTLSTDYTAMATTGGTSTGSTFQPKEKAAFETTSGRKKVYVVVNEPQAVTTHLNVQSNTTGQEFEDKYLNTPLVLENQAIFNADKSLKEHVGEIKTAAGQLVNHSTIGESFFASKAEIACFSDDKNTVELKPNVNKTEAIKNNNSNYVKRDVRRGVIRVLVTTKESEYKLPGLGKIKELNYSVGQGGTSLYLADKDTIVEGKSYKKTPDFEYKPTSAEQYNATDNSKGAYAYYDYASLWVKHSVSKVITLNTADLIGAETDINTQYALAVSHKVDADDKKTGFAKGNTTYVIVRGTFEPSNYADAAYETGKTELNDPSTGSPFVTVPEDKPANHYYVNKKDPIGTFYLGENGKFYKSYKNAVNPIVGGVRGQQVSRYEGGKMLWRIWLNPDKTKMQEAVNSPTVRNNIYHINITALGSLGTNWNPLVPVPKKPTTGGGTGTTTDWNEYDNPNNPDPNPNIVPGNTDPANPNPIKPIPNQPDPEKPTDPLPTPKTFMSVECKVLPWQVHSFDYVLGE